MKTAEKPRVLPADVYDALELSALAYGGIGAGKYEANNRAPYCVVGHAQDLSYEVLDALTDACIGEPLNDRAVERINLKRREDAESRVPFEEWCKALRVVRGTA